MAEFDLIRAVAILAIVFCHWSATENCQVAGWCCASIGNSIFFALSGLLLGLRWKGALGYEFIKRRFARIFPAYWLFLMCFFVALYLSGISVSLTELILNFCGMGWFKMVRVGRHLWFISGIILFYFVLVLLSRLLQSKIARTWYFWACGFCVTIMLQFAIARMGWHQAYLLTFIYSGCFFFVWSESFVRYAKDFHMGLSVCLGGASLFVYYILMCAGLFREPLFVNYWLAMCEAVIVMCVIVRVGTGRGSSVAVFLSKHSFEIYLIHYPLCTPGPLCMRNILTSDPWYTLCFAAVVVFLAIILHHTSRFVALNFQKEESSLR